MRYGLSSTLQVPANLILDGAFLNLQDQKVRQTVTDRTGSVVSSSDIFSHPVTGQVQPIGICFYLMQLIVNIAAGCGHFVPGMCI